MTNKVYWISADGKVTWTSRKRDAERIYKNANHARLEVWENRMDWNSARFLKKK